MKYTKVKTNTMNVFEGITINVNVAEKKEEQEKEIIMKKPFDLDDLRPFTGSKLEICNRIFELTITEDLSGEHAIFTCGVNYRIYATPNFEGVPVPIEISDYNSELIDTDGYYFPVESPKEYFKIVKIYAEKLFNKNSIFI